VNDGSGSGGCGQASHCLQAGCLWCAVVWQAALAGVALDQTYHNMDRQFIFSTQSGLCSIVAGLGLWVGLHFFARSSIIVDRNMVKIAA
jgi:hypothetical protein